MEGDSEITDAMKGIIPADVWKEIQSLLIKHEDALRAVLGGRYDWIEEVTRAVVSRFKRGQVLMTDRIDHILTRPVSGIPILLGILALVFVCDLCNRFTASKTARNVNRLIRKLGERRSFQ